MSDEDDTTEETTDAVPASTDESAPPEVPERTYSEDEMRTAIENASAESKDRFLRISAEYENFRRRSQKEREQWGAEAIERFVADLLGVLDDFDRALLVKGGSSEAILEGVKLTEKQLRSALARHGVETVDPPAGTKFDPKVHEAIQRVPPTDVAPAGAVVAVFEKGYTLKGKLLRPARVQVAGD